MPAGRPLPPRRAGSESETAAAEARAAERSVFKFRGGLVDTRAAAARAGLKPGTMASYRVRGGGPRYYRVGGSVAYALDDLDAWMAGRRGARRRAV